MYTTLAIDEYEAIHSYPELLVKKTLVDTGAINQCPILDTATLKQTSISSTYIDVRMIFIYYIHGHAAEEYVIGLGGVILHNDIVYYAGEDLRDQIRRYNLGLHKGLKMKR